ncbi:MAG: UDP-N-acetylmuramoyl-L-alanine--D-glutamate ligase [Saprospirales bacterium]|nr:UDP-N-acetylmuramoyl-L-alanine--D-glutamate ligase [Saprospirales bacterium]
MLETIGILGAGESGVGAALLAQKQGFGVFVSDMGKVKEPFRQELENHGIEFEEGAHSWERFAGVKTVVKSPGIPDTAPFVVRLRENGVEVISEIEFASRFTNATIIGITGSNGKTTTTRLTWHLLKTAGLNAAMGGNVGTSFARNLATGAPADIHVLELSSFQLDGIKSFRPRVAILLNISPDHLDRYDHRMENYVASKFRIAMNQRPEDLFILDADDPYIREWLEENAFPSANGPRLLKVSLRNYDKQVLRVGESIFDMQQSPLKGPHNHFNATCAILAAKEMGVSDEAIQQGLNSFVNAPHRLEWVAEVNGVAFIDDSKATNVDAVQRALESMDRPVIWIAGGTDKGNDYSALMPLVRQKVKALVCLGIDNEKLKASFGKLIPVDEARSAEEAVRKAAALATEGDVVLLSPACASFDLFKNYADRGDQFKAAVKTITAGNGN